jgi:hypothetical protein
VDWVEFGQQSTDISMGRYPNGATGTNYVFLSIPTPGTNNVIPSSNTPPTIQQVVGQTVPEGSPLTFAVNASDTDAGQTLSFSLDAEAPAGATIHPQTGTFSWTPVEDQGPGIYSITITVNDSGTPPMSSSTTFDVTVTEVNSAPTIDPITDKSIPVGSLLSFQVPVSDPDVPAQTITYSLDNAPAGATIDPATGLFTWTPTLAQGGSNYVITAIATDNGSPALHATRDFTVTVSKSNSPPQITAIPNQNVNELDTLEVWVIASDPDQPGQVLSYSLDAGFPDGAAINSFSGQFIWTPTEAQGPGFYTITVRVSDNGAPQLSATNTFTVLVKENNQPPVLNPIADQTVMVGGTLAFSITAHDDDLPAQGFSYSLEGAPNGAVINPATGAFSWTPSASQAPSTNTIQVMVADNGSPSLTDTRTFTVVVSEIIVELLPSGTQNGVFHLTLQGPVGLNYKLQGSQNLVDWLDILTTNSSESITELQDAGSNTWTNRFYRVLKMP